MKEGRDYYIVCLRRMSKNSKSFLLWGSRTADDEKRSFSDYTIYGNEAELYTLEEAGGTSHTYPWFVVPMDTKVRSVGGFFTLYSKKSGDVIVHKDILKKIGLPVAEATEMTNSEKELIDFYRKNHTSVTAIAKEGQFLSWLVYSPKVNIFHETVTKENPTDFFVEALKVIPCYEKMSQEEIFLSNFNLEGKAYTKEDIKAAFIKGYEYGYKDGVPDSAICESALQD